MKKLFLIVLMAAMFAGAAAQAQVNVQTKYTAGGIELSGLLPAFDSAATAVKYTNWVDISQFDAQTMYFTAKMTGDASAAADTLLFVFEGRSAGQSALTCDVDTVIITKSATLNGIIQASFTPNQAFPMMRLRIVPVGVNDNISAIPFSLYAKVNDLINDKYKIP